jgi:hypothetical protein
MQRIGQVAFGDPAGGNGQADGIVLEPFGYGAGCLHARCGFHGVLGLGGFLEGFPVFIPHFVYHGRPAQVLGVVRPLPICKREASDFDEWCELVLFIGKAWSCMTAKAQTQRTAAQLQASRCAGSNDKDKSGS